MTLDANDKLALIELVNRADTYATKRDGARYAALFTEDARMDGSVASVQGRDELERTVARIWAAEPAGTRHLTVNITIDDTQPDPEIHSTLVLVVPGNPATITSVADIRQVAVRTPDGWRIHSRTITVEALDEEARNGGDR
jgi:uncharacterized protein (TIGR02246 family)